MRSDRVEDDLDGWAEPEQQTAQINIDALKASVPALPDACIVFIYPPGPLMGTRVALGKSSCVIGRSADVDIQIDRESVSRRHARIVRGNFFWSIEDLGSTNGVFVNRRKLPPLGQHMLADGEIIRVGDTIFKFLTGDNVEAAYHEEIYRLTIMDELTETYNLRYFTKFLERESAVASRYGHPLSLIMMDIDHFKKINDVYGHPTGDLVLKEVAARVNERVRREDLFARYGGEEFALVLTHTDLEGAIKFAESVRLLFNNRPMNVDSRQISVAVSLGVATSNRGIVVDANALVKTADRHLYIAKNNGRNRVYPSSP